MKLKTVHIVDEGEHKVLILDDSKTREEGRLLTWVSSTTEEKARGYAKDITDAICQNGKLIWH
jgi:hypothetical protein